MLERYRPESFPEVARFVRKCENFFYVKLIIKAHVIGNAEIRSAIVQPLQQVIEGRFEKIHAHGGQGLLELAEDGRKVLGGKCLIDGEGDFIA